ncbi:MAG: hypothetical protein E7450_06760 [Ruminococcaceae bacterium]|nr:hypothetical protein [Oscillospiraceae bacterium]
MAALDKKEKFSAQAMQTRIDNIQQKMDQLMDVITRYEQERNNLDQFIEDADSNYQAMVERINVNVKAAKDTYEALKGVKAGLEKTLQQMTDMGQNIASTIEDATDAAKSVIKAAIKVDSVL